jgi:hypothetical protein
VPLQLPLDNQGVGGVGYPGTDRQQDPERIDGDFATGETQQRTTADRQDGCQQPTPAGTLAAKQQAEQTAGNRRTADADNGADSDAGFGDGGKKAKLITGGERSRHQQRLPLPVTERPQLAPDEAQHQQDRPADQQPQGSDHPGIKPGRGKRLGGAGGTPEQSGCQDQPLTADRRVKVTG